MSLPDNGWTAVPSGYLDPYTDLDIIIGAMVRKILAFEYQPDNAQTRAAIESIKDEACKAAERRGLDAYAVWKVAKMITVKAGP